MSAVPPPNLDALREHLAQLLRGLEHPPLGSVAALAEEVGEVSQHLLDHHAYGKALDTDALGSELADVLICLCEIATAHGISFDAAVAKRVERLAGQVPGWREKLSEPLRRARGEGPA